MFDTRFSGDRPSPFLPTTTEGLLSRVRQHEWLVRRIEGKTLEDIFASDDKTLHRGLMKIGFWPAAMYCDWSKFESVELLDLLLHDVRYAPYVDFTKLNWPNWERLLWSYPHLYGVYRDKSTEKIPEENMEKLRAVFSYMT